MEVGERRLSLWERFDVERRGYFTFLEAAHSAFAEQGNPVTTSHSGPFFVRDVGHALKVSPPGLGGVPAAFCGQGDAFIKLAKSGRLVIEEKPFSSGEIARLLHGNPLTVLHWIRAGKLPAYRGPGDRYRIARTAFRTFLADQQIPISLGTPAPQAPPRRG